MGLKILYHEPDERLVLVGSLANAVLNAVVNGHKLGLELIPH